MDFVHPGVNPLTIYCNTLRLSSDEPMQFRDLTAWVETCLRQSGVGDGLAQVQVLHTTAAVVVNENEPLLLDDFRALLGRLAPEGMPYAHDDMQRRGLGDDAGERRNGWAHARALLLGSSKVVGIRQGRLELGRWQSVLLVELDGPRERSVSITIIGHEGIGA